MKFTTMFRQVAENYRSKRWWESIAIPFLYEKFVLKPYYKYANDYEGVAIMDEEWDNLILLDACRFDMFRESLATSDLSGELTRKRSRGSNTPEFLRANFDGHDHPNTVYVTANPQVNVHTDDVFHAVVNVWETDWDETHDTVLPSDMVRQTLKAHERFPNKRLIAHFIQPHYPFIGEYGQSQIENQAGIELSKRMATGNAAESDHWNVWDLVKQGLLDEDVVRAAYRENLELVLPYVKELIDELNGKTVVTSDHGNLIGEKPVPAGVSLYGHPEGVHAPKLVTVPWLETGSDERRRIVSGMREGTSSKSNEGVDERLRSLGYVN